MSGRSRLVRPDGAPTSAVGRKRVASRLAGSLAAIAADAVRRAATVDGPVNYPPHAALVREAAEAQDQAAYAREAFQAIQVSRKKRRSRSRSRSVRRVKPRRRGKLSRKVKTTSKYHKSMRRKLNSLIRVGRPRSCGRTVTIKL